MTNSNLEENISSSSNLTSSSHRLHLHRVSIEAETEAAVVVSSNSNTRNIHLHLDHDHHLTPTLLLKKKKRNQPGHPDPNAEVIALSPKALLATNRFVCEICKKGFQRDQNLQLHRRGHNLPWKLKQRSSNKMEFVRKKVYVCPETTCVHHDPSRALGDLTGIKKHFSRKHGEKKWKCFKCCKKYAVQSDWKAHSKICGTKEYKCHCGTLFSRKDSFITHRAFCDTLGQQNQNQNQNARKNSSTIMIPTLESSASDNKDSLHQTNLPIKKEHQNGCFTHTPQIQSWHRLSPHPPPPPPGPFFLSAPPPPPPPPHPIFQDLLHQNPNYPDINGIFWPSSQYPYSHVPPAAGFINNNNLDLLPSRDELIITGLSSRPDHGGTRGGTGTAPAGDVMISHPPPPAVSSAASSSSQYALVFHGFDGSEFEDCLKLQAVMEDQFIGSCRNINYNNGGCNDDGLMATRDFLGLKESDDLFSLSNYLDG
ncbi:protein indeterminate-domain 7-like [Andrographis paniculata]|uniref:protein indeterminate-domain 7-like n=1 Tax=Andrographis paniculata TaxID=175694 RepID=UPI0021E71E09|nr:protein indeterminate-domain 7-like [Andrographis paniculata]